MLFSGCSNSAGLEIDGLATLGSNNEYRIDPKVLSRIYPTVKNGQRLVLLINNFKFNDPNGYRKGGANDTESLIQLFTRDLKAVYGVHKSENSTEAVSSTQLCLVAKYI